MPLVTAVVAVLAGLILIPAIMSANGAPQEASAAAVGVFVIFIPYAITRVKQAAELQKGQEKIIKLLESSSEKKE